MKRWLNILIVVCVLLTASSLKAEDKTNEEISEEAEQILKTIPADADGITKWLYPSFKRIKMVGVGVYFMHDEDAHKVGLDAYELRKYAILRVKNNFAYIKIGHPNTNVDSYTDEQLGNIKFQVFIVASDYPIAYHIKCRVLLGKNISNPFTFYYSKPIWESEMMGISSKDKIINSVQEGIDDLIELLATDFFTARGEL